MSALLGPYSAPCSNHLGAVHVSRTLAASTAAAADRDMLCHLQQQASTPMARCRSLVGAPALSKGAPTRIVIPRRHVAARAAVSASGMPALRALFCFERVTVRKRFSPPFSRRGMARDGSARRTVRRLVRRNAGLQCVSLIWVTWHGPMGAWRPWLMHAWAHLTLPHQYRWAWRSPGCLNGLLHLNLTLITDSLLVQLQQDGAQRIPTAPHHDLHSGKSQGIDSSSFGFSWMAFILKSALRQAIALTQWSP